MAVRKHTFDANGSWEIPMLGAGAGVPFNSLFAVGDFDGGTLYLEVCPDRAETPQVWFRVPNESAPTATLAAKGVLNFSVKADLYRVTLAGSTDPDLTVYVR